MKTRHATLTAWIAIVFAIQLLRIPAGILPANPAPARLAIINDSKSDANAAAALSAELSKFGNLQLFERDEIDKVRREQSLSAGNQDCLKLGRIIGADGLLLLESTREGTNQFLTTRLVAVKPGVILSSERFLQPFNEAEWAVGFANQIATFASKLSVLAKDAIPISIVNIRSSIESRESKEIERALTSVTIEQLSREPQLFVLERRRMQLLSSEKEFNGIEDSAFWDGSYLLDGAIDRDSYSKDILKLSVRLVPPQGAAPVQIELACPRTNFLQVVPQLKTKILDALKLKSSTPAWDPEKESEQYFEDARWAMKWRLLEQAQSACESSWSLGKKTKEVAEFRIRVYLEQGTPPQQDWLFMRPTLPEFVPNMARLAPAIHALELFQEDFRPVESQTYADTNSYVLAIDLLNGATRLLQQFYYHPESRAGHEDEVAELRLLARQTCTLIEKHPWPNKSYPKHEIEVYGDKDIFVSFNPSLADIELHAGGFWCETPEDCVAIYRKFANAGFLHSRSYFETPVIIAWRAEDKTKCPRLWHEFIQELCDSTNNLVNVEGYYIAYAGVARDDAKEKEKRASLFQAAIRGAGDFAMAGLSPDLRHDIHNVVYTDTKEKIDAIQEFHRHFDEAVNAAFKKAALANMRAYLLTNTTFDSKEFVNVFYNYCRDNDFEFQAVDVTELLPLLDDYQARLNQKPQNTRDSIGRTKDATYTIQNQKERFQKIINPVATVEPKIVLVKPPVTFVAGNCLAVTRFWSIPYQRLDCHPDGTPNASIPHAIFRNGKIWLNVVSDAGVAPKTTLFAVNPSNFKTDIIDVPYKNNGQFEILGDSLYLGTDAGLKRYSLRKQTWEDQDIPVEIKSGRFRLSLADGRLFLTTSDSIIELKEGKKELLLLASARRRPAVNVLDTLDQYGSAAIFQGAAHTLRAMIQDKIYTSDETGTSWTETVLLPHSANVGTFDSFNEGCIFRQVTADQKTYWWGMPNNQSSLELLMSEKRSDFESSPRARPYTTGRTSPAPEPSRWAHPQGMPLKDACIAMDGETTWFLANRLTLVGYNRAEATLKTQNGSHAILLKFRGGQPQPEITPLNFAFRNDYDRDCAWMATDAEIGGLHVKRPTPQGYLDEITIGPSVFFPTSDGLVVTGKHIPGFWIIPYSNAPQAPNNIASRTDTSNAGAALLAAAERGDAAATVAALARGAEIESHDDRGWTPLMLACKAGAFEVAKLLVEKGADVNARSLKKDGNFALIFAVIGNNPGVIKLMLDHGAKLNARSGPDNVTALYAAAATGSKAAAEVLISRGADPNGPGHTDEYGCEQTPLVGAACTGHGDLVELLLASGARLEQKNNQDATALMEAAKRPYADTLKLLIAKGANIKASTADGYTALIYAAYNGRSENVRLLLSAGAAPDATARTSEGENWNAIRWAEDGGHRETAALIRELSR